MFERWEQRKVKAWFDKDDVKAHKSLSENTRIFLGELLKEILDEFKKEAACNGIRNAFRETVWPNGKKHKKPVFCYSKLNM